MAEGGLRATTRIFANCAAGTTRRLVVPWVIAIAATGLALWTSERLVAADRDVTAGLWLHLPCFLITAAAVGAALESWPLFSRGRRGAGLLSRLQPPGADGCVAATAGSMTALAAILATTALTFSGMLSVRGDQPDQPRAHVQLAVAQPRPVLDANQRRLEVRVPAAGEVSELRLRPLVFLTSGQADRPARVHVSAGGRRLHEAPLEVGSNNDPISLPIPSQRLSVVEVMTEGDTDLALYFQDGAIEAVLSEVKDGALNSVLAALSYLWPAALALALATLARRHMGPAVAMATGVACLVVFTLFDWAPNSAAIASYADSRWLPTEGFFSMSAVSLAVVAGLLALAAATAPRPGARG